MKSRRYRRLCATFLVWGVYFHGPNANPPCPWWNETYAVTIYHPSLKAYILYGEIIPFHFPSPTERVFIHKGDLIGQVLRVLKKDKED